MSFQGQNSSSMSNDSRRTDIPFELATFGAGCFWCTDACYRQIDGVEEVITGYAGGEVPNPSYYEVISGTTGHAEVV